MTARELAKLWDVPMLEAQIADVLAQVRRETLAEASELCHKLVRNGGGVFEHLVPLADAIETLANDSRPNAQPTAERKP